jgi:hypothetical protein
MLVGEAVVNLPDWWEGLLLGLAAWRVWHLLAEDTNLDRPRRYITRLGDWREEGDPVPDDHRFGLREFLECPFCLGLHVSLAWVAFFAVWPVGAVWAALPFALNAVVVAVNHWLTS